MVGIGMGSAELVGEAEVVARGNAAHAEVGDPKHVVGKGAIVKSEHQIGR